MAGHVLILEQNESWIVLFLVMYESYMKIFMNILTTGWSLAARGVGVLSELPYYEFFYKLF